MRTTRKLSERQIKALKPRERPYKIADGEGLYLSSRPAGGKLWRLKYRYGGKERKLFFGSWPLPGQPARHGHPPPTAKRERYLMTHWLPALGGIPARALTPGDIRPVVLAIEARGRGEDAHRVRTQVGRVLRYAVALGHADRDVAADLGDVLAPMQSEKYATLTKPAEIAELMTAIHTYTGDPSTMYCLRILPLVFTQPGELRNAHWAEFDLDGAEPLWRIPGERMKMRRKNPGEYLVPLSTHAIPIRTWIHRTRSRHFSTLSRRASRVVQGR
jgi:hypothetical protein